MASSMPSPAASTHTAIHRMQFHPIKPFLSRNFLLTRLYKCSIAKPEMLHKFNTTHALWFCCNLSHIGSHERKGTDS